MKIDKDKLEKIIKEKGFAEFKKDPKKLLAEAGFEITEDHAKAIKDQLQLAEERLMESFINMVFAIMP